jgi:hypothetical protein
MSNDFEIEIRPNGDKLELKIVGPSIGPNGKFCERVTPSFNADKLDLLRGGDASDMVVEEMTANVSQWLQDPDLDLPLILNLANVGQPGFLPSRLIFNVRNIVDEKLRYKLADVPFELLRASDDSTPFVLHQGVSSVVHMLPKVGIAPTSPTAGMWPLRILILRANPEDWGGEVSEALPIRDLIKSLRPDFGPDLLQVDVLSREQGLPASDHPTKENLNERLKKRYDILVFVGHGDIRESFEGQLPIGVVQLETEDGKHADPVDASQLSILLHAFPVPVVLLIGCMTASGLPADVLQELSKEIPQWMRGIHGVAQALINSQSGVQVAVGMRFKIESKDGERFLKSFFTSLLGQPGGPVEEIGDIEAAVRTARRDLNLFGHRPPLSRAAPVIFRTLGKEPMFPYIATPPTCPIVSAHQEVRANIWDALSKLNLSWRQTQGESLYERILDMLKDVDQKLVDEVLGQHSALIMPGRVEAEPDKTVVVPVELRGSLNVSNLQGGLVELSGDCKIIDLIPTKALTDAGFDLFLRQTPEENRKEFIIRQGNGTASPLPVGNLFEIIIAIKPTVSTYYVIGVEKLKTIPPISICSSNNGIIVPPP